MVVLIGILIVIFNLIFVDCADQSDVFAGEHGKEQQRGEPDCSGRTGDWGLLERGEKGHSRI